MKSTARYCFLCIAILCLFLSGCKKAAEKSNPGTSSLILGFSQIGAESAWRNCNTRSVQEAAAAAGVQLLYFNAEQKQENQIKAIRSFIAYQVDVIAFVPIVTDGWEHVLNEAREAGIPVLVCDREITISNESFYAGYIGTNSLKQGQSAAEFLLKKFAPEYSGAASGRLPGEMPGRLPGELPGDSQENPQGYMQGYLPRDRPVRIVELSGTEGSSVAIGRALGFREILNAHNPEAGFPKFEIIYSESGDFLRSKGYELMCSILDTLSDIDVVFSHNDSMTLGALDAMKERGIKPGTDIVIVTIDAEQAAIDALARGEVNCVVECNPKQGPEILRLASMLARGEPIPRITFMNEEVFSEGDDLSGIPPRGY